MPVSQKREKAPLFPNDPRVPKQYHAHELIIDHRAQRDVNDERVKTIVNEFKWALFESPTIVETGRGPIVVEGQHRVRAIQALAPDALVWCMVLPSALTIAEQAQLGLDITRGRAVHSAYDQWMNALHADHPHEIEATKVLDALGVRLGKKPSTMTIACIATLRSIVHGHQYSPDDGAELLSRVLQTVMEAWPTFDHDSSTTRWDRDILLAIANMHRKWWDEIDSDKLANSIKVKPAVQWRSIGHHSEDTRPSATILFDRFVAEYNRGLRTGRLR